MAAKPKRTFIAFLFGRVVGTGGREVGEEWLLRRDKGLSGNVVHIYALPRSVSLYRMPEGDSPHFFKSIVIDKGAKYKHKHRLRQVSGYYGRRHVSRTVMDFGVRSSLSLVKDQRADGVLPISEMLLDVILFPA